MEISIILDKLNAIENEFQQFRNKLEQLEQSLKKETFHLDSRIKAVKHNLEEKKEKKKDKFTPKHRTSGSSKFKPGNHESAFLPKIKKIL